MCIDKVISILSGLIAFVVAYYGVLTTSAKFVTTRFYKWLPFVIDYNKGLRALNTLSKLEQDVTPENQRFSGVSILRGTIVKGTVGFRELGSVNKFQGNITQIIYEKTEPVFNNVRPEERLVSASLKVKKEDGTEELIDTEISPSTPNKIMRSLKTALRERLNYRVSIVTVIGAFSLLILLVILTVVSK